jgi:hypothetical protein
MARTSGTSHTSRTSQPRLLALSSTLGCLTAAIATAAPTPFTEESVARGVVYVVAPVSELGIETFGVGALFADLDNDGDPDLVTLGAASTIIGVFENDGTGHFTDRSATSGIPPIAQASGIISADYDGDGDLDLFFSAWIASNFLLRNDGGFTFTDVSVAAGVSGTPFGASSGCAWADYDNDGEIDLYIANYVGISIPGQGGLTTEENHLYQNQGDGTFIDVAAALGVQDPASPTLQAIFFDFDLDGDADLYLSTDRGYSPGISNHLYENMGGTFAEITGTAGVAANYDSMGVGIGDFDGNGLPDLYPTNIQFGNDLYLNEGNGVFVESADFCGVRSLRVGWAAHFFDFDNNAQLDLYVCNQLAPNRLYSNDGSFPVTDLAPSLGVDLGGRSYGLAVADIDNDGDLDLCVPNRGEQVTLYINNESSANGWIKLRVVGQGANTDAIGAGVTVTTGATEQIREVYAGGNSYKSQNDLTLHVGLAAATSADQIDARWPGGDTRTLTGYPAGATWTIYPDERLGDANSDGAVLLDDFFAFVAAYSQPAFAPGFERMDLDGDADVDDDDFTLFLARYTGPNGDCDSDLVSDLHEILGDPLLDADLDGVPDDCAAVTLTGDVNGDCVVDTADLGALIANFGSTGPIGDINGDNTVDTADLGALIANFGQTCE